MANVIVEYREPGAENWSRVIAAPGETYEEAAAAILRGWPQMETRQYIPLCPHGVDMWAACELCGRKVESADKLLGFGG